MKVDPVTLMEGDLDEIDDKVGDTTTESMEQFEQ